MKASVKDKQARQEALDITASYIVQAPAGSGKTELLIQRTLKLLAHVERPEEILAMTFTRKAAGEMKNRVLLALERARDSTPPEEPHEKVTWHIARQALAHDEQKGWRIRDNPQRLKIQTIDSFCASLTKQTPLLSGMGSLLEIEENSKDLYRETAHQVLALVEEDSDAGRAARSILKRLDNSKSRFLDRIVQLLNKRDQWMISFFENAEEYRSREDQERILSELIESILKECHDHIPSSLKTEFSNLARYSGGNMAADNPDHELACLEKLQGFPSPTANQLKFWKSLAVMLLTREGEPRKKPNKSIGFPSDKNDIAQGMKDRMLKILEQITEQHPLLELLKEVQQLPNPRLSDEEWEFLENMLELLPEIDKTLRRVFIERGKIDFAEIALSSKKALGQEMAPSDLLLKLDSKLHHILVDEFQDTSFKQIALLQLLTEGWEPGKGNTLFLVGDPMQSIYRFRDAEVGLFVRAKEKGLGHIPLKKLQLLANFRSQKHIVDWVNRCFSEILPAVDDPDRGAIAYTECSAVLKESLHPGVVLSPVADSHSDEEARRVVATIRDIRNNHPESSIALLVRARTHLLQIVPHLQEAGIQFRAEEIDPLTSRPAILDLLALMRALLSPMDRVSWLSILRAPWCGLSLEDLHRLCRLDKYSSVWNLLHQADRFDGMSQEGQQRAERFIHIMKPVLDAFSAANFRKLLEGCWICLGGPACIDEYMRKDIQVFFDKVTDVLDGGEFDNLHHFENILANLFANPSTGEGPSVQIMTIHKAKGLEFDFVLLPGLGKKSKADEKPLINWITHGDNLLFAPLSPAGEKDSEVYKFLKRLDRDRTLYETRRLLYVAATRTKKQLHLFGHTQMTKDGIAPQSTSMLSHLWGFIADDWQEALANIETQLEGLPVPEVEIQYLKRLPLDFETPKAPANIKTEAALNISLEEEILYEWAGNEARCLGNVLHRWFETIVKEGLDRWDARRVETMKPSLQAALLAEGMSHLNLEDTVHKGMRALKNILKDEEGRRILKHYANEKAEYALTNLKDGAFKTRIIDRTFVDNEGVRWIVDYKTGEHEGSNLKKFFDDEIDRHRDQLVSYEQLIRLQGETRKIKKALYYPLHQRLLEI
ncbi:MAG: UvrD-helicase domain-containing protein [Nitrospinae bacterium]|nr:UvrD-helicase domain-containing protein [Nitrospinota bacterium]